VSSTQRQVAALLVCYRSPAATSGAVESLLSATRPPDLVVVVDHSPAGEPEPALPAGVRLLRDPTNPGFAAGVNRGAREAPPGHDLLLLNPDAVMGEQALERLCEALASSTPLAAVSPCICHDPDRERIWFAGGRVRPLLGEIRHLTDRIGASSWGRGTGFLSGAAMLIRREAWDEVGPLDESFFLYGEDVDWCRRARRAGWFVAVADPGTGSARVYHQVSATVLAEPAGRATRAYYLARNTLRVLRREVGLVSLLPVALPRLVAVGLRQPVPGNAWWRGLRDGLQDLGGPAPPFDVKSRGA
jgi:GT2 family glycosyltransferase